MIDVIISCSSTEMSVQTWPVAPGEDPILYRRKRQTKRQIVLGLQAEKSSVEKRRVGVWLCAEWRRESNLLAEGIFKAFALLPCSKPRTFLPSSLGSGVRAEC